MLVAMLEAMGGIVDGYCSGAVPQHVCSWVLFKNLWIIGPLGSQSDSHLRKRPRIRGKADTVEDVRCRQEHPVQTSRGVIVLLRGGSIMDAGRMETLVAPR